MKAGIVHSDDNRIEPTSSFDLWEGSGPRPRSGAEAALVLLYADGFEQLPAAFPLTRDVTLVGRDAGAANLVVPQHAVSRVHASILASGGTWRVKDLDSRNGVVVSGRRVREATLAHGDELRIGDAVFKFVAQEARAYAPYRIDGAVEGAAPRTTIPGAVGGRVMAILSAAVERLARSDLQVLVHGETGTGKELIARALHSQSERRGPMLAINAASIPASLVESELFGHVKGAFSGATRDHLGVIRAADKGTLFLDEIGDMPLDAQAKLLRVLETREVVPVGAVTGTPVDVRIVSATHHDLRQLVATGKFRADLFARLDGYTIHLPPLRDRKEDLFMLVRHFLSANGAPDRKPTFAFMLALTHYTFPYNVRELASAVKRAVTVSDLHASLEPQHLPAAVLANMEQYGATGAGPADARAAGPESAAPSALSVPAPVLKASRGPRPAAEEILALLVQHGGNVSAVARALGKDRALVNRWIRADGVDPESFRPR